jgi:phenylpropionate dioxygenase-like ring-hydroxylating dioxygenase large terminal subunit
LERFRAVISGFDDLHFARRTSFPVAANWKFILDGMECYHCPVIHPQQMADSDASLTTSWESREVEFWQEHRIVGNRDLIENHKDKLPYDFGDAEIVDVYIWYLWPNMVFTAEQGPPNFMILHAQSISPETCERHVVNLCQHEQPADHDQAQFNNYTDVVFPQDRAAIERQALGVIHARSPDGRC